MQTQAQLLGQQLTFSSFIPAQPASAAEPQQVTEERDTKTQQGIKEEIAEKEEQILELRKAMLDDEEALSYAEEDGIYKDEEVSFDTSAPMHGNVDADIQYENEAEIRTLKEEIEELKEKL